MLGCFSQPVRHTVPILYIPIPVDIPYLWHMCLTFDGTRQPNMWTCERAIIGYAILEYEYRYAIPFATHFHLLGRTWRDLVRTGNQAMSGKKRIPHTWMAWMGCAMCDGFLWNCHAIYIAYRGLFPGTGSGTRVHLVHCVPCTCTCTVPRYRYG